MSVNPASKIYRECIARRLAGSRLVWNYIIGPGYNRRMSKIGGKFYKAFLEMVVDVSEIPGNTKALDVGSGPGLLTLALSERRPDIEVIGIDNSDAQVRSANKLLSRSALDNCSFRVGNAIDLPFEDGFFDVVVSTWSISGWPDMRKGMEEIRRVLVAGGRAFVVDADSGSTEKEIRLFTRGYAEAGRHQTLHEWFTRRFVFGPSVAITGDQAEALARAAGFNAVNVEKWPGLPFFRMELRK